MTERYVLSLPDAYERRAKLKEQFDFLGLDFKILDAKRISREEVGKLISGVKKNFFRIGVGTVGCFLSHIEAWKRIAKGVDRGGFIFEDDVVFSANAYEFLVCDEWIPECVDVYQLSYWPSVKHPKGRVFRVKRKLKINKVNYELINIYSPCPWGMQGYWISREGAEKALKMFDFRFEVPVDFYIYSKDSLFWRSGGVYSLTPAVVTERLGTISQRMAIDSQMLSTLVESTKSQDKKEECVRKPLGFLERFERMLCEKRWHGYEE